MRASTIFAVLASAACAYGQPWKAIQGCVKVNGLDIRGLNEAPLLKNDAFQATQDALYNSFQMSDITVTVDDLEDATIPRKGSASFWASFDTWTRMGVQIPLTYRDYDRPEATVKFTVSGDYDYKTFVGKYVTALRQGKLRKKVKQFFPESEGVTRSPGCTLSGPACLGMCGTANPQHEVGHGSCSCNHDCKQIGDCCPSYDWIGCAPQDD